jgi:serine/threonine-protein kinase
MDRAPGVIVGRPQQAVKPGTVIAEKYRVEKELGRGGFGIVVRARHLTIDQVVAIKVLTIGEGGASEWKEDAARFKREAQATAALKSDYVVRILDVDLLEGGAPYMVMEHLEGETLHNAIHTRGPLSVEESVDHIVQVLAALAEAHAAGIVHRDLKPANVFITKGHGGTLVAKVLDFGVSKIAAHSGIGTTSTVSPITKTGAVIGTVAYMAPEQIVDAKRVDARADLWSVGVMLYELLTQKTPFGPPNNATIVTSMLTKPPASLLAERPDLPPKLEKIVMRCLEKLPGKRYKTAAAVGAALAELTTPRARGALDVLRRARPPSGAAAPIEKGAPKAVGSARGGGSASEKTRRMRRITIGIGVVGAVVTVALLGLALGILVASPKVAAPRIGPRASASVRPER